jgi:DNA-binding response OmpR family regulator
MTKKVLIIEDDKDIASLVSLHISDLGHETTIVHDGKTGNESALSGSYDLVILDLMLPGMDGLEICKSIRSNGLQLPILMLTAKAEELDRVLGLELGADDYLTKPFSIRELTARVKALFRRSDRATTAASEDARKLISRGNITIDLDKRKVIVDDASIELTAKEFDLLALLASHPGRCYTRQQLLDIVWGYQFEGYDHTVNSHINRLRSKIERTPSDPAFVQTVWGVGYKFTESDGEE